MSLGSEPPPFILLHGQHMAICTPQMQRLAGSTGQKPSQLGRVHEATPIPPASWQESLCHLIQSYKSNFCGAGT